MSNDTSNNYSAFIWSVADLLRGEYPQSEYGGVILPFTVLRRLDCLIAAAKEQMLETDVAANASGYDFPMLLHDSDLVASNLGAYIAAFSPTIREILGHFDIGSVIARLDEANLLYKVVTKFAEIDLGPATVSNLEMDHLFEDLIVRFAAASDESGGEYFTPRDVVQVMVELLFAGDDDVLGPSGAMKTILDPVCGTAGTLSLAADHILHLNPEAQVTTFGQELNSRVAATAQARLLLSGADPGRIRIGNTLAVDLHDGVGFDYVLGSPPFGLEWKSVKDAVTAEHENSGLSGRFGAGLPRSSDSSFLFLQHMISKMKRPEEGGSRLAFVSNGSPLFAGAVGTGEAKIRRWIIENDWLEAVIAMPDQLLYNTGISTYVWIVTNRKTAARKGMVQLIDARNSFSKMRRSLGSKRNDIGRAELAEIVGLHRAFDPENGGSSSIFDNVTILAKGPCSIEPWMFLPGVSSEDFVEIGDVALKHDTIDPEGLPVLRVRDLTSSVTAEELELGDASRGGYRECVSRDIVGVNGRFVALGAEFGAAATMLDLIRLPPQLAPNADLLALWLSSPEADLISGRGMSVTRITPRSVVPRELLEDPELGEAAIRLADARRKVESVVDSLFPTWPAEIGGQNRGLELRQIAANASGVAQLLEPLRDVLHRAEAEYPYQIAKLVRDYRLEDGPAGRLEIGIKLAESVLRTVGTVAIAAAQVESTEDSARLLAPFAGGISGGGWFDVIRTAQALGVHPTAADLELFSTKKNSAGKALQECIEIRNLLHHSPGSLSAHEKEEFALAVDKLLAQALDGLAYLSTWELIHLVESKYSRTQTYENSVQLLNGSHPDWETARMSTTEPVAPEQMYLRSSRSSAWLSLKGLSEVSSCRECRRDELYVVDRVDEKGRRLKSLRGHEMRLAPS